MNLLKNTHAAIVAMLIACSASAGETSPFDTLTPGGIELRDQYDHPQTLAFPATNIVVLTVADRKGSEQVDGWIAALKARYVGRITFRGIADVGGAPGFLHGRIRRKFQETRQYPVMMDWSGKVSEQFGYKPGLANILIIGRDGTIHGRFAGAAVEPALAQASAALDKALSIEATAPSSARARVHQTANP